MFDVSNILNTWGVLAVALIIFAETGLLVGFFLPGDTLLIAAGVFAAQGNTSLAILIPIATIAAVAGYQLGYKIGHTAGPRLFKRSDGLLFRQDYLDKADELIKRYGVFAILIARFIVVIRTIVPLIAGAGKMDKRKFFIINLIGGIIWTSSIILASYWLGSRIPNIDHYILILLVVGMVISTGGVLVGLLKNKSRRKALRTALKEELGYLFSRKKS